MGSFGAVRERDYLLVVLKSLGEGALVGGVCFGLLWLMMLLLKVLI